MNRGLAQLLTIFAVILVLECCSALIDRQHLFSQEYFQLLQSVNFSGLKTKKCFHKDSIRTKDQTSNSINGSAVRVSSLANGPSAANNEVIGDAINSYSFSLMQACKIIAQEFLMVLSEMWQDVLLQYGSVDNSVQYYQNFASINGGAMVLSISSKSIRAPHAILQDNNDRYMYTDSALPIEIVVALKEEVSIEKIVIKSNQYYSSSINQFIVYGAFSLDRSDKGKENWFKLVETNAKNIAGEQHFRTINKVIRFLKLKVISAYGDWKYFTMTQIKVYGSSLYTEAMNSKDKEASNDIILEPEVDTGSMQLYEDLKKMINLARDGNKTIPQNNLIKYFFQELQKLSKIQERQILYMNNLTIKIKTLQQELKASQNQAFLLKSDKKGLKAPPKPTESLSDYDQRYCLPRESKPMTFNKYYIKNSSPRVVTANKTLAAQKQSQLNKLKQKMKLLESKLQELQSKQPQWSTTTLIFVSVAASCILILFTLIIIFLFVFKSSDPSNEKKSTWTSTSALNSGPLSYHSLFTSAPSASTITGVKDLLFTSKASEKQTKPTRKHKNKESKR